MHSINLLILFVFAYNKSQLIYAQSTICANNWQTYRDEKCAQIFPTLYSYDNAVNMCRQNDATLITITSTEEQKFVENIIETQRILDNLWIGLKYQRGRYVWNNNSEIPVSYTNWSEGSPKNQSELCVQMSSDVVSIGKWSDGSCLRRNLAMCEKLPTISLTQLQNMFINSRKQFETRLKITEDRLNRIDNQFNNFFSNKWMNFKTFVENNTRKALIYPIKTVARSLRSDAINICRQNNATLVDIESVEKQLIVHSFLYEINVRSDYFYPLFWLSAHNSGSGKFQWLNSGNELNYTNWSSGQPASTYPYVWINSNTQNGKWFVTSLTATLNVFCEFSFIV